jgi:SAM-dependent methyltransferase
LFPHSFSGQTTLASGAEAFVYVNAADAIAQVAFGATHFVYALAAARFGGYACIPYYHLAVCVHVAGPGGGCRQGHFDLAHLSRIPFTLDRGTMLTLLRRVLHAIDNYGFSAAAVRALRRPVTLAAPHPFDQLHQTDTSGHIPGELLATNSRSTLYADLYNTAYFAISPSTLTQAIEQLSLEPALFTFIDLGCGKGRALLIARQYQFGYVLGVEISSALADIARTNVAAYSDTSIQTGDAATVLYPEGHLVVFLYHPFLALLLKKVLANLLARPTYADLYLLAANPAYPDVFAGFPALVEQWTQDFTLSPEDRAAHPHHILFERYTLWKLQR